MNPQTQTRTMPPGVVSAIIVLALLAAITAFEMIHASLTFIALGAAITAVEVLAAVGCWRRWKVAQAIGCYLGGLIVLGGFALMQHMTVLQGMAGQQTFALFLLLLGGGLVALLLAPRSSRDWFR